MNSVLKKVVSSALATALIVSIAPSLSLGLSSNAASVPEGFVYTKGTQFMCDGSPYYFAGTNCYYVTYKEELAVDTIFENMNDMGLNVLRIWGNLDVGVKAENFDEANPVFTGNSEGQGQKDGTYFQYFDPQLKKPVVNEGANGLGKLDYVVKQAEEHNVKLIITFTNYWEAFGGMDQYCLWLKEIDGKQHARNEFYTNETMQGWYKDYIKTLLNHKNIYTGEKLMDSEAIFAWELANEPRVDSNYSASRGGMDSPDDLTSDVGCKKNVLYNWAKDCSEYVKSIDPNHMVCIGDEGMFNFEKTYDALTEHGVDSWFAFTGDAGVDFEKLMTIDTVDFGTPHMYVDQWNTAYHSASQSVIPEGNNGLDDDMDWLKLHAQYAKEVNKPVILEEFGLSPQKCMLFSQDNKAFRDTYYKKWLDLIDGTSEDGEYAYAGYTYWMIAGKNTEDGYYHDYDGYTIYGDAESDAKESPGSKARDLIIASAAKMNAKNICNVVSPDVIEFDRANPKDVTFTASMKMGKPSKLLCKGDDVPTDYYTISGNDIVIKADFLKKFNLSDVNFTLVCTEGNNPSFTVSVDDSSVKPVELDKTSASIDRNPKKCEDVKIDMTLNGNNFVGVNYNNKPLTKGKDYTVSGDTLTLKKSFLTTLEKGKAQLVLDFDPAKDVTFNLEIADTTGDDEFDAFRYENTDALKAAYSKNPNGGAFDMELSTLKGSPAAKITYDAGDAGYAGATKKLKNHDFSAYKGISFQIGANGIDIGDTKHITLQFKSGDSFYEAYIDALAPVPDAVAPEYEKLRTYIIDCSSDDVMGTDGRFSFNSAHDYTVFIPFDKLVGKQGYSSSEHIDPSNISEFSIYAGESANEKGNILIGSVYAANEAYDPSKDESSEPDDSSSVPDSSSEVDSSSAPDSSSESSSVIDSSSETESSSTPDSSSEITTPKKGDVDGNGTIDSADALEILKYVVGLNKDMDLSIADLNGDGVVNTLDALQVLKIVVGLVKA